MDSSSKNYRTAVEQSPDAIIEVDSNGRINIWNPAAEEIFGFSEKEALGQKLDLIIPEYLRAAHWKGFFRATSAGATKYERLPLTVRALHKTKPTLFIDLTFSIIKDDNQKVVGALAHARDVTSRYLSERAFREGELSVGFMTLNDSWVFTYINGEASRLFNGENLLGTEIWKTFPEFLNTEFYRKLYQAFSEQKTIHFEGFLPPLSKWVEVHAYPSPVGLAVYVRDINRQKKLEEELQQTEIHFKTLVQEAQGYAIVSYDRKGRVTSWNLGAARLYQYADHEIIGKSCSVFYTRQDRENGAPESILRRASDAGHYDEEGWRIRKDSSKFWASVSITPLADQKGGKIGFVSVTRDMAERKALDEEKSRLLEEAQNAVAARDEFLSIASHDLKSPLGTLYLQLQVMRNRVKGGSVDADSLGQMIETSEHQCQRLNRLIESLLDLTRIRMGRFKLDLQKMDLSSVVSESVNAMKGQAERVGSPLSARIDPGITGYFDDLRVTEILTNLLTNAVKYGGGKPISVSLRKSGDGTRAELSVTDQGMGIPEDMLDKVFERFERVPTGQKISGFGLGLYIVKELVDAHGGRIKLKSTVNKGSTFTVELPLQTSLEAVLKPKSENLQSNQVESH